MTNAPIGVPSGWEERAAFFWHGCRYTGDCTQIENIIRYSNLENKMSRFTELTGHKDWRISE